MIEFIVKIPEDTMPVIELAAGEEGWTATIIDGDGNAIPNPVSAIETLFLKVVQMVHVSAVNANVRTWSESLVDQAEAEVAPLISAWRDAMSE